MFVFCLIVVQFFSLVAFFSISVVFYSTSVTFCRILQLFLLTGVFFRDTILSLSLKLHLKLNAEFLLSAVEVI